MAGKSVDGFLAKNVSKWDLKARTLLIYTSCANIYISAVNHGISRYRTDFGLLVCWLVIAAVDLWLLLTLFAPFWVGLLVCCLRERTNIGKLVRWLVVCFVSLRFIVAPLLVVGFYSI